MLVLWSGMHLPSLIALYQTHSCIYCLGFFFDPGSIPMPEPIPDQVNQSLYIVAA